MKKYTIKLSDILVKQATKAIRSKQHIVTLLLLTSKELLCTKINEYYNTNNNKACVYIDKMSRIFYVLPQKMFSFQFPFIIQEQDEYINLVYHNINIDNTMTSFLLSLFLDENIFKKSLKDILEQVYDELCINEWALDESECFELIKLLILFEPGYLRYDEDTERMNGLIHPKNHLDLYYSSNNNIKIGIENSINEDWLIDLSNIRTECKFLKK